jgi:biotin synthase
MREGNVAPWTEELIRRLHAERRLTEAEYRELLDARTPEAAALLARLADGVRRQVYGNRVFVRGLIEISNICRNDCLYCGIRRSNAACSRYRLEPEEILDCCREGYGLGFRTFVLQGGEDGYFNDDRLCALVRAIKSEHPDCAVTLSLGERSRES